MTHGTSSLRPIPRVLSIAGTDPTGGAGIQADLKSIAANGGYGMAVVTALVAQNTHGVRSVHTPPVSFLREQLDSVSDDVQVDAVKIGMLGDADIIREVASWLDEVKPPLTVLDPVMVATSGDRLLASEAEDAIRDLLNVVDLVTPNLPELAVLVGEPEVHNWPDALQQGLRLSERANITVLVKGGHLDGVDCPDALVDASAGLPGGATIFELQGARIDTPNTHGTGCSMSSAMATQQARLGNWVESLTATKSWLNDSLRSSAKLEVGSGHGPINHFNALWADAAVGRAVVGRW